ncbi:hypothetical protein ACFL6Y_04845, partial [Elusimicrobiota bacterium]
IAEFGNPAINPNAQHYKLQKLKADVAEEVILKDGTKAIIPPNSVQAEKMLEIKIVPEESVTSDFKTDRAKLTPLGIFREFTFLDGTKQFPQDVTLVFPIPDQDKDGYVDGTRVRKGDLEVYYFDEHASAWKKIKKASLSSAWHTQGVASGAQASDHIAAKTDHFTLFGVFHAYIPQEMQFGEVYAFPNPAIKQKEPTLHIEAGIAEEIKINIYDASGELVYEKTLSGPPQLFARAGVTRHAYEHMINAHLPTGVYLYAVTAKHGSETIKKVGRLSIVR